MCVSKNGEETAIKQLNTHTHADPLTSTMQPHTDTLTYTHTHTCCDMTGHDTCDAPPPANVCVCVSPPKPPLGPISQLEGPTTTAAEVWQCRSLYVAWVNFGLLIVVSIMV